MGNNNALKVGLLGLFTTFATGLFVNPVSADWPHGAHPPGDQFLTNRFGRSWSEPIEQGYLFVDGRYIPAPYVVEQRGYMILVNDIAAEAGTDVRMVLPPPAQPPVTEDPGVPVDLVRTNTVHDAMRHPAILAKKRYWDHMGVYGDERVVAMTRFLEALPCVAGVRSEQGTPVPRHQSLLVSDYMGNSLSVLVAVQPHPAKAIESDADLHRTIMRSRHHLEQRFRNNTAVFFRDGALLATYPGVRPEPRWMVIFRTMAGDAPPEDKVRRLKELGFLPEHDRVASATSFYPINDFEASDQIWKRLSGDMTWTNGMDEVLHNMTNDWKRIPPQFERPQNVEIIERPSRELEPSPHFAGDAEQAVAPKSYPGEQTAAGSASRTGIWRLAAVVSAGVALSILFGLRRRGRR